MGLGLGRKKIGFYFHLHIIFWIVLNFLFMNMHVSYYKLDQDGGAVGGRGVCAKRLSSHATAYSVKTKPDVKQSACLLQRLTKQDSV